MKKIYFSFMFSLMSCFSFSQGWQYVGTPFINQSVGFSTYLYFGDLEFNSSGDVFIGYWQSQANTLFFAKYDGATWAKLPSPGTAATNYLDIEVKGNNYYLAYSGVKGSNMYVWVKKYNGTTWDQLGDSLLLGNSGSGGWFEFLLDNNEVPTLLGPVGAVLGADKQMVQYTGGAWSTVYTFAGSAPTIFRENAGIYTVQNKLIVATQGHNGTYFTVINEVDAGVRITVGDTIFGPSSAHRVKLDGSAVPFAMFNESVKSEVVAYKYNSSTWGFIADTIGAGIGTMIATDITSDGTVVFNTSQTNQYRSVYYYQNGTLHSIDSINLTSALLTVADLVIPSGSSEVYALVGQMTPSFGQDFSVVKHDVTTGIPAIASSNNAVTIYPNPSRGNFSVNLNSVKANGTLRIYDVSGQIVYEQAVTGKQMSLNLQTAGIYLVELINEDGFSSHGKLVIQP